MAAKKKTAKKAADKTAATKVRFEELEPHNLGERALRLMTSVFSGGAEGTTSFRTADQLRQAMLPFIHPYLKLVLGQTGFPHESIIEIIGAPGTGKSTTLSNFLGTGVVYGSPAFLVNTETKPLTAERMLRAMPTTDPLKAQQVLRGIQVDTAHSLSECEKKINEWVDIMRGRTKIKDAQIVVPMHIPLLVGVDSWSKLMSEGEAAGFYDWGIYTTDEKIKKKLKATNTGSNMEHAKYANAWCRRLPAWLQQNNVILFLVHHQTQKVEMSTMPGKKAGPVSDIRNNSRIGGGAFPQNSALTIITAYSKQLKGGDGSVVGKIVRFRVEKNSYSAGERMFDVFLRTEGFEDRLGFIAPALDFDTPGAQFMALNGLLGTSVKKMRFTAESVGIEGVRAQEYWAQLMLRPDLLERVYKDCDVYGYNSTVDDIVARLSGKAPMEETAGKKNKTAKVAVGDDEDEEEPPPPEE